MPLAGLSGSDPGPSIDLQEDMGQAAKVVLAPSPCGSLFLPLGLGSLGSAGYP